MVSNAGDAVADEKAAPQKAALDARFRVGEWLFLDNFRGDLTKWSGELEVGSSIVSQGGKLEVDVPAGATLWFKPLLEGPVLIEYEAMAVQNGGKNDRVSDLNCFWMARDACAPADIFAHRRSGQLADYNPLRTYYVGLGGNATTRFRRYIGDVDKRPLLPGHDLKGAENLLLPNRWQRIQLVASGPLVQFYRDGKRVFEFNDPPPYGSGWFGFRTVQSHLAFRHFRVSRLISSAP